MAEQPTPSAPAAGNDPMAEMARRAASDPSVKYRAFDSYPWSKDPVFATQLAKALYDERTAQPQENEQQQQQQQQQQRILSDIALEARIKRFEEQTRMVVDAAEYKQWVLSSQTAPPPNIVSEQMVAREATAFKNPQDRLLAHLLVEQGNPLGRLALQFQDTSETDTSWQSAAPTGDLFVDKNGNGEGEEGAAGDGEKDKEPYPKKFEEIVQFLQTGKPIEGIRHIPDTVIEDPNVSTKGRMAAPLKPWERSAAGGEQVTTSAVMAGDGGAAAEVGGGV